MTRLESDEFERKRNRDAIEDWKMWGIVQADIENTHSERAVAYGIIAILSFAVGWFFFI